MVDVVSEVASAPAETEESARPQSTGEDVTLAEQGGGWSGHLYIVGCLHSSLFLLLDVVMLLAKLVLSCVAFFF